MKCGVCVWVLYVISCRSSADFFSLKNSSIQKKWDTLFKIAVSINPDIDILSSSMFIHLVFLASDQLPFQLCSVLYYADSACYLLACWLGC